MLIVASCRLLRGEEDAVSTNLRLCVHTQTRKLWLCGTESEESLSPSVGESNCEERAIVRAERESDFIPTRVFGVPGARVV